MRVALVHDWLTGMRGGERCLQAFLSLYPHADIFTLLHVPGTTTPQIDQRVRGTSFLQHLPGIRRYYRALLPLFPRAAGSIKVQGYDMVISLSHAAAKNVSVPRGTLHICYCFTPMRYIWDQAPTYFGPTLPLALPLLGMLRAWDRSGAERVDHFVAISKFVAARIRRFYGRRADVVYPPVDTSWFRPAVEGGGSGDRVLDELLGRSGRNEKSAFLYAGALVPYKRADLVIRAFNKLKLPLWVVGKGPEERALRRLAGPTVKFFGWVDDVTLAAFYRAARALVFPAREDFGLIPVESLAAGTPVIALFEGGAKESLIGLKDWGNYREANYRSYLDVGRLSGVFFRKRSNNEIEGLCEAVEHFIAHERLFSPEACRLQAERFSLRSFYASWAVLMEKYGLTEKYGLSSVARLKMSDVKAEATTI